MAVVKEIKWGNCTIRIHDDAYRDLTPEQLAKRQEEVKNNIYRIFERAERKRLEKMLSEEEEKDAKREDTHI